MTSTNPFARAFLFTCCFAVLTLSGCKSTKEAINNDQDMRKGATDKARSSCVQSAGEKLGHTRAIDAKVNSYCDCFATQGIAKFSNTELMDIGLTGIDKMNDTEKKKLDDAVQGCLQQLQVGPTGPATPAHP